MKSLTKLIRLLKQNKISFNILAIQLIPLKTFESSFHYISIYTVPTL